MEITRVSILKKALEMARHNLYCSSADYLCSRPKVGQEAAYEEYAAEEKLLKDWLEELLAQG